MKKISLKTLNLKEVEQLSREQLKGVFGGSIGSGTGSSSGNCTSSCNQAGSTCTAADCQPGTCKYTDGSLRCIVN